MDHELVTLTIEPGYGSDDESKIDNGINQGELRKRDRTNNDPSKRLTVLPSSEVKWDKKKCTQNDKGTKRTTTLVLSLHSFYKNNYLFFLYDYHNSLST